MRLFITKWPDTPSVTMQVQSQGHSRHSGGYQKPINSDRSDSIAVQTHRRQHKGGTRCAIRRTCTDRVAATTPFALSEGDFPNPADGKK
jgi:hypothetical protein